MIDSKEIAAIEEEMIENYKILHKNPELGFEEYETSKFILKKLSEYGIEGRQIAHTGVVATIEGDKPGKTVAIRADMDALALTEEAKVDYKSQKDGLMHACGHDAHVAMLLGAAKYLARNGDKFCGNVRLIFQPAEEGARPDAFKVAIENGASELGGAASMIKHGALEGVDACFALHVMSNMEKGVFGINRGRAMASSDVFELDILGKGGHGSAPDSAIDPVGALSAILAAFNQFPSRELSALNTCVLSVGTINTDSSWNIIPDKIKVTGGVRTFDNELREVVFQRLPEIAEGICKAHRCKAEFSRIKGYSPTINDVEIAERMVDVAGSCFGEENVYISDVPLMGSEDVGYYFQEIPGALGWLGVKESSIEPVVAHNPRFRIDLGALKSGVVFHVNMAMNYLNN
ncbi:amidohydrolase [Dethiosulfatibacter aminovorans DSM 17477]|uniref:Amidohydrolase n=1 Tax=Dethiosulfatibacter aminovorans DSM 17477 TaxID=1121476 RepID=A0A1M6EEW4_9FIRM|nr:amidohydrolase [Dethiosulfatibacter aminovorans]SHI83838.1 amidohydrolase [Dethiosulfatibacter aminovorans DSM 17477]